ncbi:MAG: sugar ABC transporter ATP-binding protein [Anaerolineae bacterium]|nr:sugar ABC transporter ATP-binding protein [Anaerolineae bacterium]
MMAARPTLILELQAISKYFPGVCALRNVTFSLRSGEVHALIGENGAGKSTLTKIIAGVYPPTEGQIVLHGKPQTFRSPYEAQQAGIGVLYQEFNLLRELSIAENIFLGNEPQQGSLPFIDWKEMRRKTAEVLQHTGLSLDPDTPVEQLSVAQQQMVGVAKALHHNARLIVMDEPTTRLTERETGDLFRVIQALKQAGVAVLFISHRLEEIKQICDRATILRDGEVVATVDVRTTSIEGLSQLVLGRQLSEKYPLRDPCVGPELLRIQGLTRYDIFEDVSFTLNAGEILGIYGLVGSGRTALLRAIFGLDAVDEGQIFIDRRLAQIRSPQDSISYGIGLLTEDRQRQGLLLEMGVRENITLTALEHGSPGPLIDHIRDSELADRYIRQLRIDTPYPGFKTLYLSGGIQQKVILGKWLATGPRILLCDEPTQGIDIGGKVEIFNLMNALANDGVGIVMVSTDVTEILGMCDRFLILRDGRVVTTLAGKEADEETVLAYALGDQPDD